jgi:uncharacterized Zn finger protein
MSISIDRFEEDVHFLIAERGKEYFDAHQVLMLQQTAEGWSAVIEGSETYQVLLEGHDVINQWHCTCPFEHGPVCKHVAAVFYAVREAIELNIANASGEIDRWIDEASSETIRRILKIEARKHDEVRGVVYHEMKNKGKGIDN